MALAQKLLPNYTYIDYCRWKGRWELIDGIAFDMSPMPTIKHQRIASKLNILFGKSIDSATCDCEVYHPIDVKITENTVVNPDLLIICKPIDGQFIDFPPALVVEIISPSSKVKDKYTKFDLYQDFGIKYYIVIDPDTDKIEVFQLEANSKYISMSQPYQFELDNNCSISPLLSEIFA